MIWFVRRRRKQHLIEMSDKITKLENYARSERAIGNTAAALSYERKAAELKKKAAAKRESQIISGEWVCSCGMSIKLHFNAGEFGQHLAALQLDPHRQPGHLLTQVK